MISTSEKIYRLVAKIPKGKVTTYGTIAKKLKISPRIVGFVLHVNKNPEKIPCHRVVDRNGNVAKNYAFGGNLKQKEKLEKEGVTFKKKMQVNLGLHFYELN